MKMGRERAVLRWDIHATLLQERIARVEQALASLESPPGPRTRERAAQLTAELADLRRQLAALGPTPRAKMG